MLLLTLNDGIRDIEAMEYQPIPELTYKTPIGAKVYNSDVILNQYLRLLIINIRF